MPSGAPPGHTRGGRPRGSKNKKKLNDRESIGQALDLAFKELGKDKIVEMSPANILRFAMHVAAVNGHGLAATSFAEKAAPYFDPKLTASTLDVNNKRSPQEYTDDELERLAESPLLIEHDASVSAKHPGSVQAGQPGSESGFSGEGRIIEAEVS